jgi:predicted peptidase
MRQWPCFVVAPQLPDGSSWAFLQRIGNRIVAAPEPARALRLAIEVLNRLTTEFSIDPSRIYVTGLSMGGFGTWDALWRWPDLFAAAVPICGGGDTSKAPIFAHKPIWAFHGESDDIVPVEATRSMVNAVRLAGGDSIYTEYPGVGHDSWTPAYNEPKLFDWLFAQKRS